MGIVSSKKKSTIKDILKELEKDIKGTEKYQKSIGHQKRHLINTLFLYSLLLYVVAGCIIYSHEFPTTPVGCVLCYGPLVGFLFVIWFLKLVLSWYFHREAELSEEKLDKLKERKRAILDHVMQTRTFNEAEEILAEFHPGYIKNLGPVPISNPLSSTAKQKFLPRSGILNNILKHFLKMETSQANNYALICQKCSSHNGLVGKEQYENTAFQCCYCLYQNNPNKNISSNSINKQVIPT